MTSTSSSTGGGHQDGWRGRSGQAVRWLTATGVAAGRSGVALAAGLGAVGVPLVVLAAVVGAVALGGERARALVEQWVFDDRVWPYAQWLADATSPVVAGTIVLVAVVGVGYLMVRKVVPVAVDALRALGAALK